MEELENYIKNFNFLNVSKITDSVDFLFELVIDLYSMFTDGFLLRRILSRKIMLKIPLYILALSTLLIVFGFWLNLLDLKLPVCIKMSLGILVY